MYKVQYVVEEMGGAANLARLLEIDESAVAQWIMKGIIPPKRAVEIERKCNTRPKLRAVEMPISPMDLHVR